MKVDGNYDWFKYRHTNDDGCVVTRYHDELVYDIINNNHIIKILSFLVTLANVLILYMVHI